MGFWLRLLGVKRRGRDLRVNIGKMGWWRSRLMGANERGIGYGGDELGYDSAAKPKMHLKGGKIGEGVPIILVPSAFQTLITIYNVKEFLEDGM